VLCGKNGGAVTVHLPGGDLSVEWNGRDNGPVYLTGPAAVSFTGSVVLSP